MLKTLGSTESSIQAKKGEVEFDDDSGAKRNRKELDRSEIDGDEVDGVEVGDNEVGKKVQKTFKSKKLSKSKETVELNFLTPWS